MVEPALQDAALVVQKPNFLVLFRRLQDRCFNLLVAGRIRNPDCGDNCDPASIFKLKCDEAS
jgi:hypothetical protein